jgi:hypothetical protein
MKLFNTKINLNFIKNSAKFLILAFLIIYCIYILYFSSLKTVESFANTYDCSKCEVKPTSGNCIKIYDFSYEFIYEDANETIIKDISFTKLDTSYIFCPWEPNCDNSDNYRDNMLDDDSRQLISNSQLKDNMFGSLNNVTCCSGSDFYAAETNNYYSIFNNFNLINDISNKCGSFKTILDEKEYFMDDRFDSLPRQQKEKVNKLLENQDYAKVKNFCLNHNPNHLNYNDALYNIDDFSGILFKRQIDSSGHILLDPRLRKPELVSTMTESQKKQAKKTIIDNIISKQQLIDISNDAIKEKEADGSFKTGPFDNKIMRTDFSYNENRIKKDEGSFYQVIDKHNQRLNALKTLNMSDADFEQTLDIILYDLVQHYDLAKSPYNNNNDNNYEIYNYTPYKNDINQASKIQKPINYNSTYILDENEFLNCFGRIESVPDLSFNFTASGDFFGSSDPTLTTFEQASPNNYGPSGELEMELRRLQNVPPGGNAPVGVINQYLNAINGFYERHIANMLGPKTHTLNNQLVFENDNLEIKTPTFFKYETDPNNSYECQPSITGNDKFKDCGPTAYYTDFKP